jgi:CPA1 family monovalent cation:H+ antiporter
MEHNVIQLLLLLLVATFVGMGARRMRLPYTLALVVAGIALGLFELKSLQGIHLTPELLLPIFLPALLFEAAYHLEFKKFLRESPAILLMALPGVLVAVTVTAVVSWGLLRVTGLSSFEGVEFGWREAFIFASVIAATDPISVLSLFRSLGVTKRLYLLMEGESLLNDGIAVVVFVIVAAVYGISTGHGQPPELNGATEIAVYGLRTFLWMAGVGVALGATLGMVVSVLTRQVDDRLVEVTLSFILAYGSFIAAEELHASGVLSCVAAGVVLGSFGSRYGMSATTRVAIVDFWEVMAFFCNSLVFLLVGIELDVPALMGNAGMVGLVFLAMLAGRAVAVYSGVPASRFFRMEAIPKNWSHVMFWGGLRGGLSMVLIIGLPLDFAPRRMLLILVFGVVGLSLFVQGLTIKTLLRHLGVITDRKGYIAYEEARGLSLMSASAIRELDRLSAHGALQPEVVQKVRDYYTARLATEEAKATRLAGPDIGAERIQEAVLHMLAIEEDTLRHALADGIVSDDAAEALFGQLANRRETLRHGDEGPEELVSAINEVLGSEVPKG